MAMVTAFFTSFEAFSRSLEKFPGLEFPVLAIILSSLVNGFFLTHDYERER